MFRITALLATCCCLAVAGLAPAAETQPTEADYYPIIAIEIPEGVVARGGHPSELLPDGRLAVSSRRGEIYLVDNPFADDPGQAKFHRFAHGLHEVLGLAYSDGWLYVTRRCELTRIKDTDGDGKADLFETVSDGWEINGDYHEYAFGSKFDDEGNLWVTLCLTGSFNSNEQVPRLVPAGHARGKIGSHHQRHSFARRHRLQRRRETCSHRESRAPGTAPAASSICEPGKFVGHPAGNRWYRVGRPGPSTAGTPRAAAG